MQYCRIPSGGGDARTNGAGKGGCVLAVCVFCGGRGGGGAGGGRWCQTGRRRGEVQYTGCRRSRFFVPALGGGAAQGGSRCGVAESRCLPLPTAYRLALVSSTSSLGGRSSVRMVRDRSILRSWVRHKTVEARDAHGTRATDDGGGGGAGRDESPVSTDPLGAVSRCALRATCYGCSEALRTCPSLRPDGCCIILPASTRSAGTGALYLIVTSRCGPRVDARRLSYWVQLRG